MDISLYVIGLTVTLLTFLFLVTVFSYLRQPPPAPEKESKQNRIQESKQNRIQSDTIIDSLDWMLQHQIIDSNEYTKLMGKCLPFF
jgi:hypothetical protein